MVEEAENLLIVDDQPDNLRLLAFILSEEGYQVRNALSGAAALETVQIQLPDLILLDIAMPRMDGFEVCLALKASPQTREIPVIFLSGIGNVSDKIRAFEVGGIDYITKPFQAEEVIARVRLQLTLCSQKRRLQQEIQERKQAQAETQLLLATIQAVSEATDFETALQAVVGEVCRSIAWDYAEAWTPSPGRQAFYLNCAYYDLRDQSLHQFYQDSQNCTFVYSVGLPGRVWTSQQPEWIDNVSQTETPMFLRSQAAKRAELKAAFGIPIILNQQILAVLVFFKRSSSPFDAKLVRLVNAIALQLGGFMQRKQAEEALIQANRELQQLANIDGSTQIANRRCFNDALQQEWRRLRREQASLCVILCDIDYFKRYNDHYGHLTGDDCLKQIAQTINQTVKRPADLVARYGGEEFIVLLPDTTAEGAICIAEQIQAAIADLQIPHAQSPVNEHVTLSLGIACMIPEPEQSSEHLIAAADQALYAAKANGRNTYCVYSEVEENQQSDNRFQEYKQKLES